MLKKENSLEHNFDVCQHLLGDLKHQMDNDGKYIVNEKLQGITTPVSIEVLCFTFLVMVARDPKVLRPLPVMVMSIVTAAASMKASHESILSLPLIFQSFFILGQTFFILGVCLCLLNNKKRLNDLEAIENVRRVARGDIDMLNELSKLQGLDCRSMSWIFYNMMKNNHKLKDQQISLVKREESTGFMSVFNHYFVIVGKVDLTKPLAASSEDVLIVDPWRFSVFKGREFSQQMKNDLYLNRGELKVADKEQIFKTL